jgi:hypothetical protein
MSKLQLKAFVFQITCFIVLFLGSRFLLGSYTTLTGFWLPFVSFLIGTFLAPKFQAVKTKDGEKLFMKWIFIKGIKEIE